MMPPGQVAADDDGVWAAHAVMYSRVAERVRLKTLWVVARSSCDVEILGSSRVCQSATSQKWGSDR
jgi:hypothetical protein